MNCTLMAKGRAILANAKLPGYLWDYLAKTVPTLTNRSPCAPIGGITLYQKLKNELPDLSHRAGENGASISAARSDASGEEQLAVVKNRGVIDKEKEHFPVGQLGVCIELRSTSKC
jgi:hypothetical protein